MKTNLGVCVKVLDNAQTIAETINAFPSVYHDGYFKCRAIAKQYFLDRTAGDRLATDLASAVRYTLEQWGAGKREAPGLQPLREFSNALCQPEIRASLAALTGTPLSALTVVRQRRYLNAEPAKYDDLLSLESNLFFALHTLAERLFIENTNVTYPMKAVLLMTGFMPAFDGKVRAGLQRGGFSGMNKTQYLLPASAVHSDGKKISGLPFLLGQCWAMCASQIREGISKSSFPELIQEPGRVFDVLLFMQADKRNTITVTCEPANRVWYDFP